MTAILLALAWMAAGFIVAVVFGHMCSTEDDTRSTRRPELEVNVTNDLASSDIENRRPQYLHAG